MWPYAEIVVNIYQAFLITYYTVTRCNLPKHSSFYDLLVMAIITVGIFLCENLTPYVLQNVLFLIPLAYAIFLRKTHFWDTLFWIAVMGIIFSSSITVVSMFISAFGVVAGWTEMLEPGKSRLLFLFSSNILITFLLYVISRIKNVTCSLPPRTSVCFVLVLIAQTIVSECLSSISLQLDNKNTILAMVGSLGLLCCLFLTILLYKSMIQETESKRLLELEAQTTRLNETHQEELRAIYSNMLAAQHDMKHTVLVAKQILAERGEDVSESIKDILSQTDPVYEHITGNIGIDAVLTVKSIAMRNSEIHFELCPCPLKELPLPERSFVILLSNILDNAIEGVNRIAVSDKAPMIKLSFMRNWDTFSIRCENDMNPETITIENGNYTSSKGNTQIHGFGIKSIRKIVEEAGGIVDFITNNQKFIVKILLPM